jgi:hypothetical protein
MPPKKSHSGSDFENRPFEAYVERVNPNAEQIDVDSVVGPDSPQVTHPMLGIASWIRALPDKGATVLLLPLAGGSMRRGMLGYYSRSARENIERYNKSRGVYKPLKPGEWELMTPGLAHVYGRANGTLHMRGGPNQMTMDSKKLSTVIRSAAHRRQLHQNTAAEVMDEERFGVVQRNVSTDKPDSWVKIPINGTTTEKDSKGNAKTTSFAKEYTRMFGRDGTRLVAYQEGDCVDDTGKALKQQRTGKSLRAYREYYTDSGAVGQQFQIDEKANVLVQNTGKQIDLIAATATLTAELQKMVVAIEKNLSMEAGGSVDIRAQSSGRFSGSKATLLGPDPAPVNSAVKGNELVASVLAPLISTVGAIFTQLGTVVTLGIPTCNMLQAAGPAITALASVLPSILSTNVKVSQ